MAANTFEDKSDNTFESAELLVKNGRKNSSIHCYYYSCLQLLNHFLMEHCNYSESEISNYARDEESHNKVLNLVKQKLYDNGANPINIFTELNLIKKTRKKADYGLAFVINTEETQRRTIYFRKNFKSLFDEF